MNEASTRVNRHAPTRVTRSATRVESPTLEENEIGTIIMKRYNDTVQGGEVTHYYEDEKLYFILYDNGKNEKINQYQLNQYRCTDTDRDRTRQLMHVSTRLQRAHLVKEVKNKPPPSGGKLPAHFAMAVYAEDTGNMIDYKQSSTTPIDKHVNGGKNHQ